MLKSWAALAAPAVIALTLFWDRKLALIRSRHFVGGLVVCLVIVAPWHLFMVATYGRPFFDQYVLYNFLARSSTALESNVGGPQFYFLKLENLFSPWFVLIPFAIVLAAKQFLADRARSHVLLSLILLVFGVYSLVIQTKLAWYITPLYPALAVMIASLLFEALHSRDPLPLGGLAYAALVTSLFISTRLTVTGMVLAVGGALFLLGGQRLWRRLSLSGGRQDVSTALDKPSLPPVENAAAGSHRNWFSPSLSAAALCLFMTLVGIRHTRLAYTSGEAPIAAIAKIAGHVPFQSRGPLLALAVADDFDEGVQGPTALFYSNRPVSVVGSLDELAALASQPEPKDILISQGSVTRLAPECDFHILAEVMPYVYATIKCRGKP